MIPVDRNLSVAGDENSRDATTSTSQLGAGPTRTGSSRANRDNSNDVGKQPKHLLFTVT